MSDLGRYVRERAARDPEFADGFESGYADFKRRVLLELGEDARPTDGEGGGDEAAP